MTASVSSNITAYWYYPKHISPDNEWMDCPLACIPTYFGIFFSLLQHSDDIYASGSSTLGSNPKSKLTSWPVT